MKRFVNTITGTIHPDELGATACHEHVIWGPPGWQYDQEWWFQYPKLFSMCLAELTEYRELGGKTLVDCSGIGMGRDVELYSMLSKYSGVQIVMSTGFWAGAGINNIFRDKSADWLADMFVRELTVGIGDTGVKAGVIKVGNGRFEFSALEEKLHRAAARASLKTGATIITHGVEFATRQLETFKSEGLDLSRVFVSHCNGAKCNVERDAAIIKTGAYIGHDHWTIVPTWSPTHYSAPDEVNADGAKAVIDAGLIDHLCLSADMNIFSLGWSRSAPYVGKASVADMMRILPAKLRRVGVSEETFWKIMIDNPKKIIPTIQ